MVREQGFSLFLLKAPPAARHQKPRSHHPLGLRRQEPVWMAGLKGRGQFGQFPLKLLSSLPYRGHLEDRSSSHHDHDHDHDHELCLGHN